MRNSTSSFKWRRFRLKLLNKRGISLVPSSPPMPGYSTDGRNSHFRVRQQTYHIKSRLFLSPDLDWWLWASNFRNLFSSYCWLWASSFVIASNLSLLPLQKPRLLPYPILVLSSYFLPRKTQEDSEVVHTSSKSRARFHSQTYQQSQEKSQPSPQQDDLTWLRAIKSFLPPLFID